MFKGWQCYHVDKYKVDFNMATASNHKYFGNVGKAWANTLLLLTQYEWVHFKNLTLGIFINENRMKCDMEWNIWNGMECNMEWNIWNGIKCDKEYMAWDVMWHEMEIYGMGWNVTWSVRWNVTWSVKWNYTWEKKIEHRVVDWMTSLLSQWW